MELLGYWKIIRKRLWLIILLLLIGGVGVAYYNMQQIPRYRTSTTLFLGPGSNSSSSPYDAMLLYQRTRIIESLSNTYSELMQTRSFASMVIEESSLPLSEGQVINSLSTRYVPDTQFFRITATHANPQVAQRLANTAAQVLINENISRQQAVQQQVEEQQIVDPEIQALSDLRSSLQQEMKLYDERIRGIQAQINDLELRGPSEWNNQRLAGLRQELASLQSARSTLLTSLTQAQAALVATKPANAASSMDTAVVIDEAPLPTTPLPRDVAERTLMVLFLSLVAGVGLAVLLEYIDYTVKTPEELDAVYGVPALGVVGVAAKRSNKNTINPELVTLNDAFSPIAEAFRSLRTSIGFSALTTPTRSLLVTSAGPSEGKTFVASNLAVTLALGGKRVILVDTDLRKPMVHHMFGISREPGFTNLLMDQQGNLGNFLQKTPVKNLRILTCGTLPPNPADLLGSPRAVEVMGQLGQYADIVVYDSPPAATVTDAAIVAQHVDAVLQVVLAGGTRIDLVQRCKTVLEQVGAHMLGPVLNRVGGSDLGYYAYYYSYGYYGHSNGNGNGNGHTGNGHRRSRRSGLGRLLPGRKKSAYRKDVPAEPVEPVDRAE